VKRKEGVDRGSFIVVVGIIALGEMSNSNPLLWIKFYGSNHLIRGGLVGVIPKINFVFVLKSRQIVQFLFIVILGHAS
jgi:hypothetical protein